MCEFFLKVALDILSAFPKIENGNKYILVTMDDYLKWVKTIIVPDHITFIVVIFLIHRLYVVLACQCFDWYWYKMTIFIPWPFPLNVGQNVSGMHNGMGTCFAIVGLQILCYIWDHTPTHLFSSSTWQWHGQLQNQNDQAWLVCIGC